MSTSSVIPVMGVIDTFCERIYDRNKINIGSNIRYELFNSFESRNCHGYKLKINITTRV